MVVVAVVVVEVVVLVLVVVVPVSEVVPSRLEVFVVDIEVGIRVEVVLMVPTSTYISLAEGV